MTQCFTADAEVTPGSSGDRPCFNGGIYVLGFDFARAREILAGSTISSATITTETEDDVADLTIGTEEILGSVVSALVTMPPEDSGASKHCMKCTATLNNGSTIIICGRVICDDC